MNPWPKPNSAALEAFYGRHELGEDGRPTTAWESTYLELVPVPYPLRLAWKPETVVGRLRCHKTVAASLLRVLTMIWTHYGCDPDKIAAVGLNLFGGCYEYRRARGGASLSMHAWGAAIDFDPARNPLGVAWKPSAGMLPEVAIDAFKAEGWAWGGDFSRPDPMHFEAVNRISDAPEADAVSGTPRTAAATPPAVTSTEPGLGDRVRNTLSLPPLDRVRGPDGSYTQLHADVAYTLARKIAAGGTFEDIDFSVQDRIQRHYPTAVVYAMRQLVMDTAAAAGIMGTAEAFGYFQRAHGDPFQLVEAEVRKFLLEWKVAPR